VVQRILGPVVSGLFSKSYTSTLNGILLDVEVYGPELAFTVIAPSSVPLGVSVILLVILDPLQFGGFVHV